MVNMNASSNTSPSSRLDEAVRRFGDLTELQAHFLRRLLVLTEQRRGVWRAKPDEQLEQKLLARALYTTYMDCLASGVGDQAHALMEESAEQRS